MLLRFNTLFRNTFEFGRRPSAYCFYLDSAPDAATAIPMATASDPSATSETSTTSFEPVVLYRATSLPPAFSFNALTAPDRSDGLLTSPFTPEWEYDAYVMNKGILLLPVLSVDSGRGIST